MLYEAVLTDLPAFEIIALIPCVAHGKAFFRQLTFAVGDGNHSLASAKACWEELKKTLTPEQREQVEAILRGTEQTRTYLLKIRAQVQTPLKYKRP